MNTYRWTCEGCKTPNVLVHDPDKEDQVTLNCLECGTPGVFEPVSQTVIMRDLRAAEAISTSMAPRYLASDVAIEVDYSDPTRVAKIPRITWR